jgi:flavodoxin
MQIAIVYDSSTGTTAKAAESMGKTFRDLGHECHVLDVRNAKPADVAQAELLCIGSWIQGLFVIRQHPTSRTMAFINQLGDLTGKRAVVFCTYKIAAGRTLHTMATALRASGATVVGQFKFRGPVPNSKFAEFASSLV